MSTDELLKYWRKRCLAAEKFIGLSPCDPDIYPEQYYAYVEWERIKAEEPKEEN